MTTAKPRKATGSKAKPPAPTFDPGTTPEPSPTVATAAPEVSGSDRESGPSSSAPASAESERPTSDAETSSPPPDPAPGPVTDSGPHGDGSTLPAVPSESPTGPLAESPAPGTVAHEALSAQIAAQDGPPPVFAGTFAIYADGSGGYVLVVAHADGTTDRKHIPAAMVKLAQSGFLEKVSSGGGFLGKLIGGK